MTDRGYTMRELLTQARARFGERASRYKTRQELLEALSLAEPPKLAAPAPLVVRDFFVKPAS